MKEKPMRNQTISGTQNVDSNAAAHLLHAIQTDVVRPESKESNNDHSSGPLRRLEGLLSKPGNRFCADCDSPDPKWVSLGVHISKVLSLKLDEWTDEQVDYLEDMGGNAAVNMRYEAFLPEYYKKPRPDSSIEDRSDFIRRKYQMEQFVNSGAQSGSSPSATSSSNGGNSNLSEKKQLEKQHTSSRLHGLGQAFRNSWRRKDSEQKAATKKNSTMGMIEFVGLIKVNVVKGTNLAVRDVLTSDPYVILTMGHQTMKTRVIRSNLNPIWNERLMLSIPEPVPPLKVQVYDKDTFSADDRMGEAEIDIQPLVTAAKAYENSTITESMQLGKWLASDDNSLVRDSLITLVDGNVRQEIAIRLQNVERGELEIELECVPLSQ